MDRTSNKKLLRQIRVIPVVVITLFILITNILFYQANLTNAQHDIAALSKNITQQQRAYIKDQVNQRIQQIVQAQKLTTASLRGNIKNRIYEAHAIATSIYENNKHYPPHVVKKLISDALRNIRFSDGRGYFFIYQLDGLNVMHPILKDIEGTSMWHFSDDNGTYVVRELVNIVKTQDEGFLHWLFVKNNHDLQSYEKIGFVKAFKPFNWFIGTGDYVSDAEQDVKNQQIKLLQEAQLTNGNYFVALDEKGTVLSFPNSTRIGQNFYNYQNVEGELIIQDMLELSKVGGFMNFAIPTDQPVDSGLEKIAYVKQVPNWNWSISTGWFTRELDEKISYRQHQMATENEKDQLKLVYISIFTTLFALVLSLLLGRVISKRLQVYQRQMTHDFKQITHSKNKMQHMALHDALTNLPNRVMLEENIADGINESAKMAKQLAVMFVDLDDFKKVNDLYGHTIGDRLLTAISCKLRNIVGVKDTVSRFGGDEFVFCFPCLTNKAEAEKHVAAIQKAFSKPFTIDGKVVHSTCSIGVAMYPNDAVTPEDLISKADIVLYKSKERNKGDFLFFDDTISERVLYDFKLEEQLRSALIKNELYVLYQPQICAKTGHLFGIEALVRWHNSELGHISPIDFINIAEKVGLINDIGFFVLQKSCQDFKLLSASYPIPLCLSINISPKQLIQHNFASIVRSIVSDYDINPERITLEITENILIDDLEGIAPILAQLKAFGFDISLDDFGTGYSSLGYLSNLPISEIKIDQSFIDKFLTSHESQSLIKAIIAIGEAYNLRVVAEGVETVEQKDKLIAYHCDVLQGYYFDKPKPILALEEKYGEKVIGNKAI